MDFKEEIEQTEHRIPKGCFPKLEFYFLKLCAKFKLKDDKIISLKNKNRESWDGFVLGLSLFNAIVVPLELSFEMPFTNSIGYSIIDNIIDVLFIIDMILMFITSYRNIYGEEIRDQGMIAKHYVKSIRFLFDFASLFGTGIVTQWLPSLKVFKCFKIVRVFRLNKFITGLKIDKQIKGVL